MGSVIAAVIAVAGAFIVGFITNFVAEDYRRFRDGTALAASLAGELSSHGLALPDLQSMLETSIKNIVSGNRPPFRFIDKPADPIFSEVVGRLGLLGSELVEDVVFTYQQINVFRIGFGLINKEHASMSDEEIIVRLGKCLEAINRAEERSTPLVLSLKNRAAQQFKATSPWEWYRDVRKKRSCQD